MTEPWERVIGRPEPHTAIDVPTRYGLTHLEVRGPESAPPLLLLPAMGVTSSMWSPNIGDLSRHFRVFAVDTIGDLGRSKLYDQDRYPKNGRSYAHWLADVLNAIGAAQGHILGSSMGGWIAMNLAIHAPSRVDRMVLLGPMGLPSWFTTAKVFAKLWRTFLRPTKANIDKTIQWALGEHPSVRQAFAPVLAGGVANRSQIRLAPPLNLSANALRRISAPTLLILGASDNVIGDWRAVSARARKNIPGIQVEVIAGAGHLTSTEAPDMANRLIIDFLTKHRR